MREIKFQVVENNRIVAVESSDSQYNGGTWYHCLIADGKDAIIRYGGYISATLDGAIRRQYTGLKDKNGKEAYFGDVYQTARGAKTHISSDYSYEALAIVEADFAYLEVTIIGNIYENPELREIR